MAGSFRDLFVPGSLTFFRKELILASDRRFPLMLNVEPTNDCNLNCVMCARRKSSKPVSFMPLSMFSSVMDEARAHGGIRWLAMHKDGESLLHPDLAAMVACAKRGGAAEFVHMNTNALLLDEAMAERLITAGLDSLTLSVDAFTQETYARVKGGGDLDTVRRNAHTLLEVRRRLGASTPVIRAKIIEMPATRDEIEPFRREWTGVADEVQVQPMHNHAGGVEGAQDPDRRACSLLWYSLAVNSDGTVSTCCLDYSRASLLGDLRRSSLASIFQGATLRRYRLSHVRERCAGLVPCEPCNVWRASADLGEAAAATVEPGPLHDTE